MEGKSEKMKHCLVIGGGGFLGRHIVEKLQAMGLEVCVFDIRKTYEDACIKFFVGNLCKKDELLPALRGVDTVFHCATPSPLSNNKELFLKVNYEGTKTLIAACKEVGVKNFVLTSSASVVYEGTDILNGTEDIPYAAVPMDYYTQTKILQEQVVLDSNSDSFQTVAVRPHGIFGPRDPHLLPTVAKTAKAGKTKFIIGPYYNRNTGRWVTVINVCVNFPAWNKWTQKLTDVSGNGENIVDFTYVDNVVHGHILAAQNIHKPNVAGKAFHITNDEPLPFWSFMTKIVTGLNYPPPSMNIPFLLIYVISSILQFFCWCLKPLIEIKPTFTPMTVCLAGTHHYYSCERAKKEFGYKPLVCVDDGIKRTLDYYSDLKSKK